MSCQERPPYSSLGFTAETFAAPGATLSTCCSSVVGIAVSSHHHPDSSSGVDCHGQQEVGTHIHIPPLEIVRFTGRALSYGIEQHVINRIPVRVYSHAKTVADCFKFRNKIGLDIAIEALRETWRSRRATMDDLWRAAKICRMANVMRPCLKAMT
jgi:hypothetical protein